MTWFAVGTAALGVVGGIMNSGDQGGQTTQNTIDPRIAQYLYGSGGQPGLLGNVSNLQAQQSAQGGLNPMQNAGLEMQRQTLMSPQYTQGYDQMRNLGAGLLSQGVAGNPFTQSATAQGMAQQVPNMTIGGPGGMPQSGTMQTMGVRPNLGFQSAATQPVQQGMAPAQSALSQSIATQALLARQPQPSQLPPGDPWMGRNFNPSDGG